MLVEAQERGIVETVEGKGGNGHTTIFWRLPEGTDEQPAP